MYPLQDKNCKAKKLKHGKTKVILKTGGDAPYLYLLKDSINISEE